MSKKKATMTLKDFHGGSIPSDLPLPSAPGVTVRALERNNFDRHTTTWGNPIGRSDQRLRPGSAGTIRAFDDKTPFLSHNTHIGRNFDEDEWKPLDGVSGPRRTVSDDNFRGSASCVVEPKLDYSGPAKLVSHLASTSEKQHLTGLGSTNSGRSAEVDNGVTASSGFSGSSGVVFNHQNMGGTSRHVVSGSSPNAWGLRQEAAGLKEPSHALSSSLDAAVKLAHASALEKVSSGRWHSQQLSTSHPDVEGTQHSGAANELYTKDKAMHSKNAYNSSVVGNGNDYQNLTFSKQTENIYSVEDGIRYGGKDAPGYERTRPANERTGSGIFNVPQLSQPSFKSSGSELQSAVPYETSERPKLKLLPRSKPLDIVELPVDYNQGYQNLPVHAENQSEFHEKDDLKAAFVGSENENQITGRPKLNLKPRSGPLDHFDGIRNTLFGGARPRELVLKERGVDNPAGNYEDLVQPSYRIKQDTMKVEKISALATTVEHNEKQDIIAIEQRKGKNYDKREHCLEAAEKTDFEKRNWRGEKWRNKKEPEKQQLQPERPTSPETWRKPIDQPQSASTDASGVRHVKAASAVELAQAFSRSVSDPSITDGQRGLPNRQFSRLMQPTPRPQVNGY